MEFDEKKQSTTALEVKEKRNNIKCDSFSWRTKYVIRSRFNFIDWFDYSHFQLDIIYLLSDYGLFLYCCAAGHSCHNCLLFTETDFAVVGKNENTHGFGEF